MKRILTALAIAATANAGFDIEFAGRTAGMNFRGVSYSETGKDGKALDNKAAGLKQDGYGMFTSSFGGNVSVNYSVIDDLYVGLSTGFNIDTAFSSFLPLDADGKEGTASKEETDQYATSWFVIPVYLNVKYDVIQFMENKLNLYANAKGGWILAINNNTNGIDGEALASSKQSVSLMNYGFGANVGVEFYGAQLSLGYNGTFIGVSTPLNDDKDSPVSSNASYANHNLDLTLGYRLTNLF